MQANQNDAINKIEEWKNKSMQEIKMKGINQIR